MVASSDPLVTADMTPPGLAGKEMHVACREPSSCISGRLRGPSAVVYTAIERLEAIHQSAHALRGTDDD